MTHPTADQLRDVIQRLRRTPMPLADLIPLMTKAADHLDTAMQVRESKDQTISDLILEAGAIERTNMLAKHPSMMDDAKDHHLREVISEVTATARLYAQTEQLRERVRDILLPVLQAMQASGRAAVEKRKEVQVQNEDLKRQIATARLDLMRELKTQGWNPPSANKDAAMGAALGAIYHLLMIHENRDHTTAKRLAHVMVDERIHAIPGEE